MALTLQGSIDDERVRLYFDVVSNKVTAVQLVNESARTVRVTVYSTNTGSPVASQDVAPGTSPTVTLANNRRFDYDAVTADWRFSLQQVG